MDASKIFQNLYSNNFGVQLVIDMRYFTIND